MRNHLIDFLGIFYLKPFEQKVFKFVIFVFELFMEVVPGKAVLVEQVNHNVQSTLYVVASGLIVASTTIKTRKHEIP